MKFWDTSAVVPLCLAQPASADVRPLLLADGDMVVWWGTVVECTSALARLERNGELPPRGVHAAFQALGLLRVAWTEVAASEAARDQAAHLLRTHPLRAGDALQLVAALVWSGGATAGLELVTLDDRLRSAAVREGFSVLPQSQATG